MKNNKNRFKLWYDKYINRIIPSYGVLSLLFCFVLNSTIYTGTQIILDGVERYDFTSAFDRKVPFVKEWIFVYLICFLFWAVNYILITREGRKEWFRFATADMMSRMVCCIFFILLPTTNIRPEVTGNDFASTIIRFVYAVDKPTNLFPSIHCLVSWFCFIGIRRSKKIPLWYKFFSCIFALLVCASTQFTKQHYIIDVFAGIILAEVCFFITTHTNIYTYIQNIFEKINRYVFGESTKG